MEEGPDGRAGIDAGLVSRLLAEQFPQWADLPVRPVPRDGWDNRTYRLGEHLSVRLPTAAGYVPAVAKEQHWLAVLAPHLPRAVPTVLATGRPGMGYPYPWSIRSWLPGRPPSQDDDLDLLATELAEFLVRLRAADASNGPAAAAHSWYRGGSPAHYDDEVRTALARLDARLHTAPVDLAAAAQVWDAALQSGWDGPPVWFHGDVAAGNLLLVDGRLSAVIDFGTCGVGDPACDLVIAWTLFTGTSRSRFRAAVAADPKLWARARGWALWKALIVLAADHSTAPANVRLLADLIADFGAERRCVRPA